MTRFVYAIYVNCGSVGACLDAVRLLANPQSKRYSHLTVRGPYSRRLSARYIRGFNKHLSVNDIVIDGAGNFFSESQTTVFFRCRADHLKPIWRKPDYEGFNPHITVYNNGDRKFATRLFEVVAGYTYRIRCGAGELSEIPIGNGENGLLIDQIKVSQLPPEIDLPTDFRDSVLRLSSKERLVYVDRICAYMHSKLSCSPR